MRKQVKGERKEGNNSPTFGKKTQKTNKPAKKLGKALAL